MKIQVGLWWWKWKPLKLSKSPHAGDWWLDDFGHDDDNGDDSADDDGDDNDDDDAGDGDYDSDDCDYDFIYHIYYYLSYNTLDAHWVPWRSSFRIRLPASHEHNPQLN